MHLSLTNDVIFKKIFASEENIPILQHFASDMLGFSVQIQASKAWCDFFNQENLDDAQVPCILKQ